jgi:hypothetical protein
MPNPRIIRARINAAAGTVTFTAAPGVAPGLTFHAGRGDTLIWQLSGGEDSSPSVQFGPAPPSPVSESEPLTPQGSKIAGTIRGDAVLGDYRYKFNILGPGGTPKTLDCIWESEAGGTMAIEMGGGVITDPPPS